jgi:hypothetical protein
VSLKFVLKTLALRVNETVVAASGDGPLFPPLFVDVSINPHAGAPQAGLAVRVKVALPSAIFVDRKTVALASLLDSQ